MAVAASCHFLSVGSRALFLALAALAALAAAFLETAVVVLPPVAAAAAAAPRGGTGEGVTPLVSALADLLLLLPPFLDLAPAAAVTSPLPGGGVTAPPPAPASDTTDGRATLPSPLMGA